MKIAADNTLLHNAADRTIQAGAISDRIKKMYCDAADIKGVSAEIAQNEINKIVKQFSRPLVKAPVSQPQKPAKQPIPIEITHEPLNDTDKPPVSIKQFNWRKAAFFLMACFCVTLFVNLWFYVSREIQFNMAAKTGAHIKQLISDTANANKRSQAILGDIDGSKTEIGRVKAELDNSAVELKRVHDELAAVRAGIADIRQGNSDAVKRLTEQIRKLTGQLAELKNSVETGTEVISDR
jgi:hypothetical protein